MGQYGGTCASLIESISSELKYGAVMQKNKIYVNFPCVNPRIWGEIYNVLHPFAQLWLQ